MNKAPIHIKFILGILTSLWIGVHSAPPAYSFEKISLKKYKSTAIKIDNPVDLTRLPVNKTFQVNSPDFILQFFFSGPEILGIVFKRDLDKSLLVRWCFFRNCEESPFDYVSIIGPRNGPPLANGFFQIKHPPGMDYRFQGLYFFSKN